MDHRIGESRLGACGALAVFMGLAALIAGMAPASAQSGSIVIIGSDTLGEAVEAWADGFADTAPDVAFDIESAGSGTAPPALTSGRAQIAPMSRPMSEGEVAAFQDRYGYRPTAITIGLDALAVYVHKDNPVSGLTLSQLDQIFSSTHLCGGQGVGRWDEVAHGVRTLGEITLHSRNEVSGTFDFFRQTALCGGDFKPETTFHADSRAVVEAVAADINAIGYSGLGYRTDNVRALAIGSGPGFSETRYFPITIERFADSGDPARRHAYVIDGRYPLSRPLFFYVNKAAGEALPDAVTAFLTYVLSQDGQDVLERIGYIPLPANARAEERAKLQPDYRPRRWWFFN